MRVYKITHASSVNRSTVPTQVGSLEGEGATKEQALALLPRLTSQHGAGAYQVHYHKDWGLEQPGDGIVAELQVYGRPQL